MHLIATEQCEEQGVSSSGLSVIIALVVIILAMVVVILSLIIAIVFQLKRAMKLSATLKRLHATNPLLNNDMILNFAYQSTSSVNTVQYETIPESSARTTLSRNSAYQHSTVWLPEGNRNLREQVPPTEAVTEMESADGSTFTRQQEPRDYLLAVSTSTRGYDHLSAISHKTNTAFIENTTEDADSEDRERGRNSPDLVDLLLASGEENGQVQEVYLQGDRGSNQEEGGELKEQRSDTEQSVHREQPSTVTSTNEQSEVEPVDKPVC